MFGGREQHLLNDEDILLLLVAHGRVEGAGAQVHRRLLVVRGAVVACVLVEGQLSLFEHAVDVHPGLTVEGRGHTSRKARSMKRTTYLTFWKMTMMTGNQNR